MKSIKKIIIAIACIALFTIYIFYNRSQDPTEEDVFRMTKSWKPSTIEIYEVMKRDGEWLAFFRNENSIMVARLEQNWMGTWKTIDYSGIEKPISSLGYPASELGGQLPWKASGYEGGYVIFMLVEDPLIDKLVITTKEKEYDDISFIEIGEKRFVLLNIEEPWYPFDYQAFSKEGELIAPIRTKN